MISTSTVRRLVLVLPLLVTFAEAAEHTNDSWPEVRKNVAEKQAVLVDVRETVEWNSGHIAGAISLPPATTEDHSNDTAADHLDVDDGFDSIEFPDAPTADGSATSTSSRNPGLWSRSA